MPADMVPTGILPIFMIGAVSQGRRYQHFHHCELHKLAQYAEVDNHIIIILDIFADMVPVIHTELVQLISSGIITIHR